MAKAVSQEKIKFYTFKRKLVNKAEAKNTNNVREFESIRLGRQRLIKFGRENGFDSQFHSNQGNVADKANFMIFLAMYHMRKDIEHKTLPQITNKINGFLRRDQGTANDVVSIYQVKRALQYFNRNGSIIKYETRMSNGDRTCSYHIPIETFKDFLGMDIKAIEQKLYFLRLRFNFLRKPYNQKSHAPLVIKIYNDTKLFLNKRLPTWQVERRVIHNHSVDQGYKTPKPLILTEDEAKLWKDLFPGISHNVDKYVVDREKG